MTSWVALLGSWDAFGPFASYDEAAAWLVSGDWVETAAEIWTGSEPNVSDSSYPRIVAIDPPADLIGLTLGDAPGEFTVDGAVDIARDLLDRSGE